MNDQLGLLFAGVGLDHLGSIGGIGREKDGCPRSEHGGTVDGVMRHSANEYKWDVITLIQGS